MNAMGERGDGGRESVPAPAANVQASGVLAQELEATGDDASVSSATDTMEPVVAAVVVK
jgi:hypothetical protein